MLEIDDSEKRKLLHEETTGKIIGAAFEVHDQLGYAFLQRVYQRALLVELLRRDATAELEKRVQVFYKGTVVGDYDIDVLVDSSFAVEVKVASQYDKRDKAQLLNELKATELKVGMLVNFGRTKVEYKRLVF
jgi:GxxExxY protein